MPGHCDEVGTDRMRLMSCHSQNIPYLFPVSNRGWGKGFALVFFLAPKLADSKTLSFVWSDGITASILFNIQER